MGLGEGGLTRLDDIGKLLAHGHHEHLFPEILSQGFWNAERPCAALHIARILPDRLDAALEEVDRVFQLESTERKGIEDLPERFHSDDIVFHES